jgi:hypothetical protein
MASFDPPEFAIGNVPRGTLVHLGDRHKPNVPGLIFGVFDAGTLWMIGFPGVIQSWGKRVEQTLQVPHPAKMAAYNQG